MTAVSPAISNRGVEPERTNGGAHRVERGGDVVVGPEAREVGQLAAEPEPGEPQCLLAAVLGQRVEQLGDKRAEVV